MDDIERDKKLLTEYPFHIYLMVKAAKKALEEGRAHIQDGILVLQPPTQLAKSELISVEKRLDVTAGTKVESSPATPKS